MPCRISTGLIPLPLYILGGEFTPEQEQGLVSFVRDGGGLLAVHGANAGGLGQYQDYIEMLGTELTGHDPIGMFEVETVQGIDDVLPRLEQNFRVTDECYNLKIRTDAPLRWFQHGSWRFERKPLG